MEQFSKMSVVRKYCKEHPETPHSVLARIVMAKEPKLFSNYDSARSCVRKCRGKQGHKNREEFKNTCEYETIKRPDGMYIPEGQKYSGDSTPYELENDRSLLLCDIHAPYHDRIALEVAAEDAKKVKVDTVVINGDGLDFYQMSRFQKDPRKFDAAYELRVFKDVLKALKSYLKCRIIIKEGNHDERFVNYMMAQAPALLGIEAFRLDVLINNDVVNGKCQPSGVDALVIPARRALKVNQLNIVHGHEFGKAVFSPVNPARGLYTKAKECAIQGHLHQTSSHTEKTMDSRLIATWSVGCLCDLSPEYARYNNWNHGYAIIDRKKDGFQVQNKRIINGQVYS
jgi:predicted phosphodiesterase